MLRLALREDWDAVSLPAAVSTSDSPHYVSSDPRNPVSLKKKCVETIHSPISLLERRALSQGQFSPIIIVIQAPYPTPEFISHGLSRGPQHSEDALYSRRQGCSLLNSREAPMAVSLKGFGIQKIMPTPWDLFRACKWAFWCCILVRVFFLSSPSLLSFYSFLFLARWCSADGMLIVICQHGFFSGLWKVSSSLGASQQCSSLAHHNGHLSSDSAFSLNALDVLFSSAVPGSTTLL